MQSIFKNISSFGLSVFALVTFSSAAYAQVLANSEIVPESLKITGRGIQDESSKDVTLMACVGESLMSKDVDCETLRLVKLAVGKTPIWVSYPFKVVDITAMTEKLSRNFGAQSVDGVFSYFHGDRVSAFTSQDGWNWAASPLALESGKYTAVVQAAMYTAQYNFNKQQEYERKLNDTELSGKQGCHIEGTMLSEAREKGSARTVVYSSNGSQVIFTLCTHGVSKELKRLTVTENAKELRITGEHYSFNASRALIHATSKSYRAVAHFFDADGEFNGGYALFGGIIAGLAGGGVAAIAHGSFWMGAGIGVAAPWALPVVPVLGTVVTVSIDAIITGIASIIDKDAIAARKFHKLVTEKNVKMKSSAFESMITRISGL